MPDLNQRINQLLIDIKLIQDTLDAGCCLHQYITPEGFHVIECSKWKLKSKNPDIIFLRLKEKCVVCKKEQDERLKVAMDNLSQCLNNTGSKV